MNGDHKIDERVTDSSGDVFIDLGIACDEQEMLKIMIASAITKVIQRRRLTQKEAGDLIGIDQPKVPALVSGKLDQFSIDRLIGFLILLGLDVDIKIGREPRKTKGRVTVAA